MGYLVHLRGGPGALPDVESYSDAANSAAAVSCHLEIQVDILAGELESEFFIWIWCPREHIWSVRLGSYSEFCYQFLYHGGSAWGDILQNSLNVMKN